MELKGFSFNRLPESKKEKMLDTLKRMENIRRDDSMWLRDRINEKVEELCTLKGRLTDEQKSLQSEFNEEIEKLRKTFTDKANALNIEIIKIDSQLQLLNEFDEPVEENKEKEIFPQI